MTQRVRQIVARALDKRHTVEDFLAELAVSARLQCLFAPCVPLWIVARTNDMRQMGEDHLEYVADHRGADDKG